MINQVEICTRCGHHIHTNVDNYTFVIDGQDKIVMCSKCSCDFVIQAIADLDDRNCYLAYAKNKAKAKV